MATTYLRDYDKELMSQEDYEKLQGYKKDWANATDEASKLQANKNAESLRNRYGYYRGGDGAGFGLLNKQEGVSDDTGYNLLKATNSDPTGKSDFYNQWKSLVEQYNSRDPFSYDMASDGLYQQYADQYTRLGSQAMQDTLGQAAALTGGYNSSYAQNAGQQAYQGYLDQLNDIVPELYEQAWGRYEQEGDDLMNRAQMAADVYGQEVTDYWNNMEYWADRADQEQSFWQTKQDNKQTAYSNLVTTISNTGYSPTDAELSASGMSREEANAWRNYWITQNGGLVTGGSGGGGGSGGSGGGGGYTNDDVVIDDTSPAYLAGQFFATHSGYINDKATEDFMNEHDLHGAERQEFVRNLKDMGMGYSWNPDPSYVWQG